MNYIVLDLEWNQCPEGKYKEKKKLPFEIIEIGAVKIDENMDYVDSFSRMIRPQVYKEIHYKTKEIVHLERKDLEEGSSFVKTIREFIQWCGQEYRFCTWGSMDLVELQRNMEYYHVKQHLDKPLYYFDIQNIFSRVFEDGINKRALEWAVDYLELPKDIPFHRADTDANYTAKIMKSIDKKQIKDNYSVDYYHNPKNRKEEIYIKYEDRSLYISKEFDSKEKAMTDREVSSTRCILCGKPARKKIRWFSTNTKVYYCLAWCEDHGFLRGKISMKKAPLNQVFVEKIINPIQDLEVEELKEKREQLRKKRKLKRQKDRQ